MCMSAVILVKFCPPAKSVSSRWASINQLWTSIHIQFNNFFAILQCMSWKPGEWTVESTVALRNIRKILEIASAHNWKKITRNFVPRTDEGTGQSVCQLKIFISRLEGRNETGNCQKIMSLLFGSCVSSFSGVPSLSPHNTLVADYTIINLAVDYLSQYSHN